jgi:putative toxin-antitoxin system antitoxin component (TIGR02293 family)
VKKSQRISEPNRVDEPEASPKYKRRAQPPGSNGRYDSEEFLRKRKAQSSGLARGESPRTSQFDRGERKVSSLRNKKNAFKQKITGATDELLSNKISVLDAIEEGLPYDSFKLISENTPFPEKFWADALGLSTKSLDRYKKLRKRFKPLQSEKILEVAETYNLGQSVFNDDEKLSLWLNTPNFALGSKKPIDLIKTSYGKEMVITELTNIDQGIFI